MIATDKGTSAILNKVDTLSISKQNISDTLEHFKVRPTIDESDTRIPLINKIVDQAKTIQGEHKIILQNILLTDMEAFAKPGEKLKQTNIAQHHLPLRSERVPVNVRSRPMSATETKIALEVINGLVQSGVLERCPAPSPYNTPFAVLPKSTPGKWRLVSLFVKLNSESILVPMHPMPRIDDNLAQIRGFEYKSVTDFQDGFYQVGVAEEDRQKTAMELVGVGQFRYARMAQGLTGAPATFNYVVHSAVGWLRSIENEDQRISALVMFVDDMYAASQDVDTHLYHWHLILKAIISANLTLSASKTSMFQSEVQYCGRMTDGIEIWPLPDDIEKVCNWKKPHSFQQLNQILGFVNYLTEHSKDEKAYAKILRSMPCSADVKKILTWTVEGEQAWIDLIATVRQAKRLAIPEYNNPSKPFVLYTDASDFAAGAALCQRHPTADDPNNEKLVSYYSKAFNRAQQNYKKVEKEAYACVCALLRFRKHIYGQPLVVKTDAHILEDCFKKGDSNNAMINRWLMVIQDFAPVLVQHISGETNVAADALSRNIHLREQAKLDVEVQQFVDNGPCAMPATVVTSNGEGSKQVDRNIVDATQPSQTNPESTIPRKLHGDQKAALDVFANIMQLQHENARVEQLKDAKLKEIIELLESSTMQGNRDDTRTRSFMLVEGVLYKIASPRSKLVVPESYRPMIMYDNHNNKTSGHYGIAATAARISQNFYWKSMWSDVVSYCNSCTSCSINKPGPSQKILTGKIGKEATHPFHTINLDIKGPLPTSKGGNRFIVAFICTRTNWVEAYATTNHKAKTVSRLLVDVIMKHGAPKQIITDKGSEFGSDTFRYLLKDFGIKYEENPPYSPFLSGKIERFNRTLGQILRHYLDKYGKNWDEMLPFALIAYRTAHQESLKCTPFYALYGRHAETLTSVALNIQSDITGTVDQSTHATQQRMREAVALAESTITSSNATIKELPQILPGHMIMVQTRSSVKWGARWLGPYRVTNATSTTLEYENHRGHIQETNRSHAKHALIDSTMDEFLSHQERYMSDQAKRREKRKQAKEEGEQEKAPTGQARKPK